MEQSDLLKRLTSTLEALGIPYLITGSVASIAYGEPRFTNDIDVIAAISPPQVPALCSAFPAPDFTPSEWGSTLTEAPLSTSPSPESTWD